MVLPVRAVRDPQDFVLGRGVSATRLIGRTTISSQDRRPSPSLNSELLPSGLEVGFQPRLDLVSSKIFEVIRDKWDFVSTVFRLVILRGSDIPPSPRGGCKS